MWHRDSSLRHRGVVPSRSLPSRPSSVNRRRRPSRQRWRRFLVVLALVATLKPVGLTEAGHEDGRILMFAQPLARADAVWMAQARGYFKAQRLDVAVRWWPSGTEALGVFQDGMAGKPGFGDFVILNEVAAVEYWQRTGGEFVLIAAVARDADSYVGIARADVTSPRGLRGKAVATTVGSTSAWFLGEYLRAHGMSELDVAVKNMPPEDIREWPEDIAAFFVREPHAAQALSIHGSRVHRLTTAKGLMHGYLLLGTWRWYLRDHPGVAERVLAAIDQGRAYAAAHRDEVIHFAREMFGHSSAGGRGDDEPVAGTEDTASVEADYASNERVAGVDAVTVDDLSKLSRWMHDAGVLKASVDPRTFFDLEPLRTALPERLAPALRREGGGSPR